jgi:hypothetical protein
MGRPGRDPRPETRQADEGRLNFLSLVGGWQRWAVYGALAAMALGVAAGWGYHRGIRNLWEYQAEQARAAIPVIVKQGAITERVVVEYRDRVVKVKGETQFITKEIVRYVPASADPVLPRGWVLLHDAAATRTIPAAPEGVDVAAPAVAASKAVEGVVENYGACHGTAIQLLTLQAWVRAQYEAQNQEPLGY